MDSLDKVRTELGNADKNLKKDFPKTLWSKYYHRDRKVFLDAEKERDSCVKAVRYFEEKVCNNSKLYHISFYKTNFNLSKVQEVAVKINAYDRKMEGEQKDMVEVDLKLQRLISNQKCTFRHLVYILLNHLIRSAVT